MYMNNRTLTSIARSKFQYHVWFLWAPWMFWMFMSLTRWFHSDKRFWCIYHWYFDHTEIWMSLSLISWSHSDKIFGCIHLWYLNRTVTRDLEVFITDVLITQWQDMLDVIITNSLIALSQEFWCIYIFDLIALQLLGQYKLFMYLGSVKGHWLVSSEYWSCAAMWSWIYHCKSTDDWSNWVAVT